MQDSTPQFNRSDSFGKEKYKAPPNVSAYNHDSLSKKSKSIDI